MVANGLSLSVFSARPDVGGGRFGQRVPVELQLFKGPVRVMMNRAKTEPPARDQVRVKPGEKPMAASAKPPHDDAKLLALLQSAKRELQGLRLVHLHLSLLKEKSHSDI